MRIGWLALVPITVSGSAAAAHPLVEGGNEGLGVNDIMVASAIAAFLLAFVIGWRRMPSRRGGGKAVASWRAGLFVAGILTLAVQVARHMSGVEGRMSS